MESDFFRDVGTGIFKPVGDFISGAVTAMQPGRTQQVKLQRQRIESLLQSEKGRRFLIDAQTKMYKAREDYYKGDGDRTADPRIEQISKLIGAADSTADEKLSKSLHRQVQYLIDELDEDRNRGKKAEDRTDFIGPPAPADYFREAESATDFVGPPAPRDSRLAGQLPASPDKGTFDRLADFIGPPAPKTYEQLGVTSVDEMATLEEMQKALPDRDMREEYESDPEYMRKLIKLWKEGKLNASNLHKAFSALQQRARGALGIA